MTAEGMRRKIGWKSRLGGWSGRREPPVAGRDRNVPGQERVRLRVSAADREFILAGAAEIC